jgi:hypothetical protein
MLQVAEPSPNYDAASLTLPMMNCCASLVNSIRWRS